MTLAMGYRCDDCRSTAALDSPALLCRRCGGLLEVEYDLGRAPGDLLARAAAARELGMWRWHELLPLPADARRISLGEGDTPLSSMPGLGARLRIPGLLVKNDSLMPTGSFKDRGFALAVSFARQLGIERAFTYSSGNAGASFAAYAAGAGMAATVLVEESANDTKTALIRLYGARVLRLRYDSSVEIFAAVSALAERGHYSFVNFINPVRHEAMKTYAYEICEKLGRAPDVMVHPVGTGGGLWGAWKGFLELRQLGVIDRLPRMVGVQPAASAPLVRAFLAGETSAAPYGDASRTVAQSIAGDAPIQGGRRLLRAFRDSGGRAVAVEDSELFEAMRLLGRESVAVEPSAAASVAALFRAREDGWIAESDTVVSVVTGAALKQPAALQHAAPPPAGTVRADPDALAEVLSQPD
jgi:threonine synthase